MAADMVSVATVQDMVVMEDMEAMEDMEDMEATALALISHHTQPKPL